MEVRKSKVPISINIYVKIGISQKNCVLKMVDSEGVMPPKRKP